MLYSSQNGAAFVASNRLSLGAKPGEARALATDPKAALLAQIGIDLGQAPGWADFDLSTAYAAAAAFQALQGLPRRDREDARLEAQAGGRQVRQQGTRALLTARLRSEAGFAERWAAFLSNHLCVSATAGPTIQPGLPTYEVEVIRAHAFGPYAELVKASAKHPAMLVYLDQWRSVGPNSLVGQRRSNAGLNENYARELLELHTVGVDGGYDLDDIQELAKLLTGWTIMTPLVQERIVRSANIPVGTVTFLSQAHEPGRKTVMGQSYGEGEGAIDQVITDLCALPQTARFLSSKILRHFVGQVREADLDRLAAAYLTTGGDLGAVAAALLALDSTWQADTPIFRTPLDYLTALMRGLDIPRLSQDFTRGAGQFLTAQNHLLWSPSSPQGFSEDLDAWADPNALKTRTEFVRMAMGTLNQIPDASELGEQLLDLSAAPDLASALGNANSREDALTLLLASPQFMWR